MVVGFVLWMVIGAALGFIVKSEAFLQGWADAGPDQHSDDDDEKSVAGDRGDRRLLIAAVVSAVVAGLIPMVIIGESVVGLLVSLVVAAIAAGAVLLAMSALTLTVDDGDGQLEDHTPLDQ